MEHRQVKIMKIVLLASSLASLGLLVGEAYRENFSGEWRDFQGRYGELLLKTAKDENARRAASLFRIGHKQIYLPDLNRIDRCTTCHLGISNPAMADAGQPLKIHPGEFLAQHPVERFGCTICHLGQGRAITRKEAHGRDGEGRRMAHMETPLLRGDRVYTSCGRCHYETDLFGGYQDLYAGGGGSAGAGGKLPIHEDLLRASPAGAAMVREGKRLMVKSGCLGCHKYRGRGGTLGPEITHVGDKGIHDFDFTHLQGEHTVERWLIEHFLVPAAISPDTIMPDMGFTREEAAQLAHYMMSLHRKSAPASHLPRPPQLAARGLRPVRGETLYSMFCSACHGPDGSGSTLRAGLWPTDADPWGRNWDARNLVIEKRSKMEVLVPSLNHADTLAVASDEYLHRVIAGGRPGTKMIGWSGEGGLRDDEITLLVHFLRNWAGGTPDPGEISASRGDARIGGALYRSNCAACHGVRGEGGIGVSLCSSTFLAVASDGFLRDTIIQGRSNTAMPAWREFNAQEVSDLLAFLRQWQSSRASPAETLELLSGEHPGLVSAGIGRKIFRANCVMCHGEEGGGDLGPSINTEEFLTAVPDSYLVTTLMEGRPGTAMPSWRHRSSQDLASLVRHIRGWQEEPAKPPSWHGEPVPRGDPDTGKLLFRRICSGCHGVDAEGATGPQLNNRLFLSIATDRMLLEWIARGKLGTEMRGFRKGGQGIAELGDRQMEDLVAHLRSLERLGDGEINRVAKSPNGRPEKGKAHYGRSCSGCHGPRGEGASGPALSNGGFLRAASDGFLLATLALGRSGTEMRPAKRGPQSILQLSSDEVNDIVALLRSWESSPPLPAGENAIPHRFVIPWDFNRGRVLYTSNCSGCHGAGGKGSWAPELNNEGFLAAATDGFLQATIVRGRRGTAMRPFGRGRNGLSDLSPDDIDNIVAYIRSWSRQTPSPLTIPAERSREFANLSVQKETE